MYPAAVVVVGAALVDVRAEPAARWEPGPSLPGRVRVLAGGAGRNVAVDLARLGHRPVLLSAVGVDPLGAWLLEVTAADGVDVSLVERRRATGMFVTVGPGPGRCYRVADAAGLEGCGPAEAGRWAPVLSTAALVACDANLLEPAQAVVAAASQAAERVLLATSPDKAPRLRAVLPGAAMLVGTVQEAAVLSDLSGAAGWEAHAAALRDAGVAQVVVTCEAGIGVLDADGAIWQRAVAAPVVDPTGAGDAVAAAMIHARLVGWPPDRAAAFAARAAAAAVASVENTPSALAALARP
jgi:pseudouridine kinase